MPAPRRPVISVRREINDIRDLEGMGELPRRIVVERQADSVDELRTEFDREINPIVTQALDKIKQRGGAVADHVKGSFSLSW